MSKAPSSSHPFFHWMLPGLIGGMVLGGFAVWKLRPREMETGQRRLALAVPEEVSRPGVPRRLDRSPDLEPGLEREKEKRAMMSAIPITSDLREAVRALMEIGDLVTRQSASRELVREIGSERWPELVRAFAQMEEAEEFDGDSGGIPVQGGLLAQVLSQMAAFDAPAALKGLQAQDDQSMSTAFNMVLAQWAARDLTAALAYHTTLLATEPDAPGAEALAREYAKRDPAAAVAWLSALPPEQRNEAYHSLFEGLAHSGLSFASRLVVELPDLTDRGEVAANLAAFWAKRQPDNALAWAASLPPELANLAVKAAYGQLKETNWSDALVKVGELAPSQAGAALEELADDIPDDMVGSLAATLSQRASTQIDSSTWRGVAHEFAEADAEAASHWVAALPPGAARDAAISGFASQLTESEPEAATIWSTSMADPGMRRTELDASFSTWLFLDPAAARQWLRTTERLNAPDRARLLERAGS